MFSLTTGIKQRINSFTGAKRLRTSWSLQKRTFASQSNTIYQAASRVNDVNEHARAVAWSEEMQTIRGGNHKQFMQTLHRCSPLMTKQCLKLCDDFQPLDS